MTTNDYVQVGLGLLRNAVTPVGLRLLGDRRSFGIDARPERVHAALTWLAGPLAAVPPMPEGARVLELGPGRTAELAKAFVLAGADRVTGLDTTVRLRPDAAPTAPDAALSAWLTGPAGAPFLAAVGATPDGVRARSARLAGGPLPVSIEAYDGATLPLPDGSVDLVVSKSVLEHVHPDRLPTLLAELRRVVRPGGAMVHLIDLRDPTRVDGDHDVTGDWLDALRYSEPVYRAMYSHRATLINRLRAPQWRTALTDAGFAVQHWESRRLPLPPGFDRSALRAPWSGYAPSDLDVSWVSVAVQG